MNAYAITSTVMPSFSTIVTFDGWIYASVICVKVSVLKSTLMVNERRMLYRHDLFHLFELDALRKTRNGPHHVIRWRHNRFVSLKTTKLTCLLWSAVKQMMSGQCGFAGNCGLVPHHGSWSNLAPSSQVVTVSKKFYGWLFLADAL